jgi:hypothetical protein
MVALFFSYVNGILNFIATCFCRKSAMQSADLEAIAAVYGVKIFTDEIAEQSEASGTKEGCLFFVW